jgi:glutathione synthase/RimK-type ligase-like ATP-grasp enzyme
MAVLDAVARVGTRGRTVAVRVDVLRASGLRYARQRLRYDSYFRAALGGYRRAVYRAIWLEAAQMLDAQVSELPGGFLEITGPRGSTCVRQHSTMLNGEVAVELGTEKAAVYRLLESQGLPVPDHLEFDAREPFAAANFLRPDDPCVVKPGHGGGGFGVTSNVRTLADLRRATLRAGLFANRVIIERQATGDVHRLLFLDGELIDTIRRRPPHLTGDGRSTIAQLALAECRRRVAASGTAGLLPLWIDLDAVLTLRAGGLSSSSVLPQGVRVPVKAATNQNAAEENATCREVSRELVDEAAKAVAVVGLRLGGVDVITTDLSRSLAACGGVVLEVNRPALHHHYLVAEPERATRVAVPVLEAAF